MSVFESTFDGWEELTSSVERCSEGIVIVGCVAIWCGRADFSTVGYITRGLETSSSGNEMYLRYLKD